MSLDDDSEGMVPPDLLASDRQMDALARGDDLADTELGALIRAAQGPARADELAGRDQAVSLLVTGGADLVTTLPKRRRGPRSIAATSAVVLGAIVTASAAAAAATGVVASFSDPASPMITTAPTVTAGNQTSERRNGSSNTPSPASMTSTVPTSSTVPDSTARGSGAVGPNADGAARRGLCTAFGSRETLPGKSVAAENLTEAATAAGQTVDAFCAEASSTVAPTTSQKPVNTSASAGGTPNSHANPAAGGSSNANPNSNAGGHGGEAGASNPSPSAGGTPNEHSNPAAGGSSSANPDSSAGGHGNT